jgi:hypothetical protein
VVVPAQHQVEVTGVGVEQVVGGDLGRDDEHRAVAAVFAVAGPCRASFR